MHCRPMVLESDLICRARRRHQDGVPVQQYSVIDTDGASNSPRLASPQRARPSIPSVSVSGPDSPARPQPVALHPSAHLEPLITVLSQLPTGASELSGSIVAPYSAPSPSLESADHTVSSLSPHSAPLSLLCEATSLAESLSVASEPIPGTGSQHNASEYGPDINMDHAGPSPVNAPRSRASSISSGMSYDEAKDVSGELHLNVFSHIAPTQFFAQVLRIQRVRPPFTAGGLTT